MKKIALLFLLLFFFGTLTGEEIRSESKPGTEEKTENAEYGRKKLYVQPLLAAGASCGGEDDLFFGVFNVSVQVDFLVADLKRGRSIYMGFDAGFKYNFFFYQTWDVPLNSNIVFDFKTNSQNGTPENVSLWFSFGMGIAHYNHGDVVGLESEGNKATVIDISWGIGTDLKFMNNIVLQFAVKSFAMIYIIPTVGIGYRF